MACIYVHVSYLEWLSAVVATALRGGDASRTWQLSHCCCSCHVRVKVLRVRMMVVSQSSSPSSSVHLHRSRSRAYDSVVVISPTSAAAIADDVMSASRTVVRIQRCIASDSTTALRYRIRHVHESLFAGWVREMRRHSCRLRCRGKRGDKGLSVWRQETAVW